MLDYRKANSNDILRLLELEQSVIEAERPFNTNIKLQKTYYYDLERLISSNDTCFVVAEDSGTIIGTGYAQIRRSKVSLNHDYHAYLGFMFVAPEFRGKGINLEIVNELISWSKKRNVCDFYLEVYSQNVAAIKAYEKAGFKPCVMEMKLNLEGDT